ncbi:hypothetical protein [Formosa haliotis]|uniref:hypothetical protein n=1 Tax=Formosa haliotis TaxID=1555194 RepID=UPI0009F59CFD|nr:hypothetical protein [Formosa haliotis]
MRNTFFLICLFFVATANVLCQNLILNIEAKTETDSLTLDSIGYKKHHNDYISALNAIDTLSATLNRNGFFAHNITPLTKNNDTTYHSVVHLNKKYTHLYIRYNTNEIQEDVLKSEKLNIQDRYIVLPIHETEQALKSLNSKLANQGLPFSTLKLNDIKIEHDSLKADLITSTKETPRNIDNIIIKGYEKFPEKYIKHYADIKKGDLFNMNEIIIKTKRLNKLPFANLIRDPEVLFTKDSTTLYIYVEKQKSNNFDGYLGFTTNEDTNKLEFSGYLNMLLRNNLNFGEALKIVYQSDENDQKTFNINVDAPYIFKSPIGANIDLNIFKKDSTFTTVNQSLKLYYQLNTQHKIYLGYNSTNSNNLLKENIPTNLQDYKASFVQSKYNYINYNEDNLLFPTKSYADLTFGMGTRTYSETKENQIQFEAQFAHIFNLNERNSIYAKITASGILSDTYLENELLRFGGINSIRGFEENSLTANLYGVLNLEYRYQLSSTIFVHSITDFSYFEDPISSQKEKLLGLGVGFAILTKAGLLKMNYANGKTENLPFSISNAKIHLSITSFF